MKRTDTAIYIVFLIITAIGVATWQSAIYPVLDDLPYSREVTSTDYWACNGSIINSFTQLWDSIRLHYQLINGRLANLLALIMIQMPKWLSSVISGLMAAAMADALIRLGRARTWWGIPLAVLLMWAALPWYDGMASLDFYINYVYSSALALWVLVAGQSEHCLNSRWKTAAIYMLAIAAGWMHEGIATAAIGYSAISAATDRQHRKQLIWLTCALLVGFLINAAGATSMRALNALASDDGLARRTPFLLWCRSMLSQFWPLWLGMAACAAAVMRHGNYRVRLIAIAPAAGAIIASLALLLTVSALNRTAWGLMLGSIILVLRSISIINPRHPRIATAASTVVAVVYALWFVQLTHWQRRVACEEFLIAKQAVAGADTIKVDLITDRELPFTLMGMVYHPLVSSSDNNYVFARHYMRRDGVAIIPASKSATTLAGSDFIANECMIMTGTENPDSIRLKITYGEACAATTPINRILAILTGKDKGFTAEATAYPARTPGLYFYERPGRLTYGRRIERMEVMP